MALGKPFDPKEFVRCSSVLCTWQGLAGEAKVQPCAIVRCPRCAEPVMVCSAPSYEDYVDMIEGRV